MTIRVGTAGWAIPGAVAENFPSEGNGLERYAGRFTGVEINSSFYRSHRHATWARWAASVPEGFSFAVKLPRLISHEYKLLGCGATLSQFFDEVDGLGAKLAILLLQLPPKFAFDARVFADFVAMIREASDAVLVCEPRHASWFEDDPDHVLARLGVARVAADPACVPAAARPGGWSGLQYWRLHGSPRIYRSRYEDPALDALAKDLIAAPDESWCVFDNTAAGAAAGNALSLSFRLDSTAERR